MGGKAPEDLRSNFSSFWQSNLTLFQCLSGENWTDVMYGYMDDLPVFSPMYFACWTVFGNYVLLNLFVAVITENIELDDSERETTQRLAHEAYLAEQRLFDGKAALGKIVTEEVDETLINS